MLLPENVDEKRKTASGNLQAAGDAKVRAEAKLLRLKEESESLNVRNELLDNEEAILAIHKELGAVEKTIKDLPQQEKKRRLLRNEAGQLLKGVRPEIDLDSADQLRPLLNNKKWISRLAQKHGLLNQKKEKAEAILRDVEDHLGSIKKELGEQPQPNLDLAELKAAIAAARKAGDLEQRLADSQKRASDDKVACESELARIGRFSATSEALLKAAMPVPETLDTFEKQIDELLEQHLSKGKPMPFIVDDILTGFDDNRTRVCIEVLARLAASTQVLLFTHHRRVVELADAIEARAGVYIHELV